VNKCGGSPGYPYCTDHAIRVDLRITSTSCDSQVPIDATQPYLVCTSLSWGRPIFASQHAKPIIVSGANLGPGALEGGLVVMNRLASSGDWLLNKTYVELKSGMPSCNAMMIRISDGSFLWNDAAACL